MNKLNLTQEEKDKLENLLWDDKDEMDKLKRDNERLNKEKDK